MVLYGIKNCDTVRKARAWLDTRGIDYRFHDFRADGLTAAQLSGWAARLDWQRLLNRASTTFRQLPPERSRDLDASAALALMLEASTLIKRPLLDTRDRLLVGFKPAEYQALLETRS